MKRMIAIALSVLLLAVLTSCISKEEQIVCKKLNLDKATLEIGATHSDFEGVEIWIVNAVWNDEVIRLDVNWSNQTRYEVMYGDSYEIQREDRGKWRNCVAIDNLAFNAIGYELQAGETQMKTYELTDIFDISQNGKYRFTTDCFVYDKGRDAESTNCELWAEFTVTRVGDISKDTTKTFIDFVPQYIRTNSSHGDAEYPLVKIIRSVDELNDYYEANKERYDLERKEALYSDTTIGFLDACDRYDEAYFEDQILVMVLLQEGSGSVRHNVDYVKAGSDGKLYIDIRTVTPEVGTCDMAEWHVLIEPEKNVDVESEADVIVYLDGINPNAQPSTVRKAGAYSNIAITVPHNWNYETERGNNSDEYCISFWPADQAEGKIQLYYYTAFGVCGTGLEEKEITVGAYKARQGTYDNKKVWDYIVFSDLLGFYVAKNKGADRWWDQYGDEAMQILSSAKLAEGIITEQQAVDLAKKEVTVEYDQINVNVDTVNGYWIVSFSKENTLGGDQVLTLTHEGKIIDVEYGE